MTRPAERLLELDVTGYANGGSGIARSAGRVVFVDGALPGERVVAQITDDSHAAYAKAVVHRVLEPSAHRVEPGCRAAAAGAGCCDLSFVAPDFARSLGAQALADVLRRIGGFDFDDLAQPEIEALGDSSTGWRIRTRLAVDRAGRAGLRGRRSAQIVTEPCAAPVTGLLDGVDDLGARPGTEIVLMADADGGRHAGELAAAGDGRDGRGGPGRRRAQRSRGARSAPRALRPLDGADSVTHRVGDREWRIRVTGFWQAHRDAPRVYSMAALEMLADVGVHGRVHVWDLYGGAGVFSAALLDGGAEHGFEVSSIDLVDTDPGALAAARETLASDPVHAHRGGVAESIAGLRAPQVVVSDPPRAGAGLHVVDAIAAARPDAVVHVGCDAASFARDLGRFATHGYRVRGWRGFDAFPMTHHIEAIAVLTL
ncbi:class I SAM-dependent RNA methyltransferase [Gordonia neofelifaecis]|uniref:SAM-dependent methyltransferase n=1 Tax=Gordonia neofelifaecis NRRL B-59395 TaxID=644548 RepID=F1YMM6_9ACTN|nr:TRAM domain-containing protein [Gordonia neofelifaecis]EGD53961.1 SAM-dependent methyltransferase [Gordonia neofelifaecis NRRL B-59395]